MYFITYAYNIQEAKVLNLLFKVPPPLRAILGGNKNCMDRSKLGKDDLLKGVFAKNERGYRLTAIKKLF